jgi:hypothetical protein
MCLIIFRKIIELQSGEYLMRATEWETEDWIDVVDEVEEM